MMIIRIMAPIALGMIMSPIASRLQMMWHPLSCRHVSVSAEWIARHVLPRLTRPSDGWTLSMTSPCRSRPEP